MRGKGAIIFDCQARIGTNSAEGDNHRGTVRGEVDPLLLCVRWAVPGHFPRRTAFPAGVTFEMGGLEALQHPPERRKNMAKKSKEKKGSRNRPSKKMERAKSEIRRSNLGGQKSRTER